MTRFRHGAAPRPPATPWLAAAMLGLGIQAIATGAMAFGALLAAGAGAGSPPQAPRPSGPGHKRG